MRASPPQVMGILNVTPDSFHDGGRFVALDAALAHARRMIGEGADWIDVGGESTRPGAGAVDADEELARVLPVVAALRRECPGTRVSVDTSRARVARACLEAGACAVNDVTALSDPDLPAVVAAAGCDLVLMHMQGTPRTMQRAPTYGDVLAEVRDFLLARVERAERAGIDRGRIWIDPGLGFGKTRAHNLALLRGLPVLCATGLPVLVGASRKSFIGQTLDLPATQDRLEGSLAVAAVATWLGAAMLRVHDVRATRHAAAMAWAIGTGGQDRGDREAVP